MPTATKTKIGRGEGECDNCGEKAEFQIYDVRMVRKYQKDGQGEIVNQRAIIPSLVQLCKTCFNKNKEKYE